jgi:hypothetical protein
MEIRLCGTFIAVVYLTPFFRLAVLSPNGATPDPAEEFMRRKKLFASMMAACFAPAWFAGTALTEKTLNFFNLYSKQH